MNSSTRSAMDDLTFDVITVLQKKARALEAYDKYLNDAKDDEELHELFTLMRHQDEAHLRVLKDALARRLDDEPGYDDESYEDEEEEDEDEEDVGEEVEDEAELDEETAEQEELGVSAEPPPRRGESTHRR